MCLIVFAYRTVPGYSLILAANRDEFYKRPALPAHFWKDIPGLLAGKDLKAGGTWMGIHTDGRYAALTNYRNMGIQDRKTKSRGNLVRNYLKEKNTTHKYLEHLAGGNNYNGFNLLVGDSDSLFHFANITGKTELLKPGIHGISNDLMNTSWPKVESSKNQLRDLLKKDALTEEQLFKLLQNKKRYPLHQLPDTGLPKDLERAVSAAFIQTPDYGTRCSTLLYIKEDGNVLFIEKSYIPGTDSVHEEKRFEFKTALH